MPEPHEARRRIERLAWFLDDAISIPGTRWRIGWDGLIGMIPGIGDVLGALLSLLVIAHALWLGVPKAIVTRMLGIIALDTLIGAVPFLGDFFDFTWKANRRNARLLTDYLDQPERTHRHSRLWIAGVLLASAVLLAAIVWATWSLIAWISSSL